MNVELNLGELELIVEALDQKHDAQCGCHVGEMSPVCNSSEEEKRDASPTKNARPV